jgi:phage terminase large subunit-like protein
MKALRLHLREIEKRLRIASIALLPSSRRQRFLETLSEDEAALLRNYFRLNAHPYQLPPDGDWTTWLLMGGRGCGKTKGGAEWTMERVALEEAGRVALIGETLADVRDVMIEGPSGIRKAAMASDERPVYYRSQRKLMWGNGAQAFVFSAEDPDSLRGHAFDLAWCDEFAKWRHMGETFDMLQMALRDGAHPRQLITTTPRNRPALKRLLGEAATVITRAKSEDNSAHLAPTFFEQIARRYEGTRLGRQELGGEMLEDLPGALWTHELIDKFRVGETPETVRARMIRIVVAVDPPVSVGPDADECGIVAVGKGADGLAYVLADRSAHGLSPKAWGERAIGLYHALKADCVVAEVNQGGELVRTLLAEIDSGVPVRAVHASRGKSARAEPVAALYEQGRVRHVGCFAELEDQMCAFGGQEAGDGDRESGKGSGSPDGRSSGAKSPDRVDALVWAVWELMLRREPEFRVRRL